ncbi:MAG: tetratricopeptide repeat protein [Leptolyngbya sp. SIO1E4]|nr:tetratricopeptide repeat protein [Leptolyngbya sp. SIO1E4]
MASNQSERLEQAQALYDLGQLAFERGNYREAVIAFEEGTRLAGGATPLGGSIQLWLMNAYSAANRQQDAIALGEKLTKHPDGEIRKQSKRVVEILKAPQLKRRADWTTPIPDLSNLEASDQRSLNLSQYGPAKTPPKAIARPAPKPEDLSQINTRDNGFFWIALALILLTVGGAWVLQ